MPGALLTDGIARCGAQRRAQLNRKAGRENSVHRFPQSFARVLPPARPLGP